LTGNRGAVALLLATGRAVAGAIVFTLAVDLV
jgi:hypothetical protein